MKHSFKINSNQPILKYLKKQIFFNEGKYLKKIDLRNNQIEVLIEQTTCITTMEISPDKKNLITGNKKGEIIFYDICSFKQIQFFKINSSSITDMNFHKKYFLTILADSGKIFFFDFDANSFNQETKINLNNINKIIVYKNFIFLTQMNFLKKIDKTEMKLLESVKCYNKQITTILFMKKKKYLITGACEENIKIWDIQNLRIFKELITKDSFCLSVSPDEMFLISTNMNGCILWNLNDFLAVREFSFDSIVNSIIFCNNKFFISVEALSVLKINFIDDHNKFDDKMSVFNSMIQKKIEILDSKLKITNNSESNDDNLKKIENKTLNNKKKEIDNKIIQSDEFNIKTKNTLDVENELGINENKDFRKNKGIFPDKEKKLKSHFYFSKHPTQSCGGIIKLKESQLPKIINNRKNTMSSFTQNNSMIQNEFSLFNNQNSINNAEESIKDFLNIEKHEINNNFGSQNISYFSRDLHSDGIRSNKNSIFPEFNSNCDSLQLNFKKKPFNEKNIIHLNYSKNNFDLNSEISGNLKDLQFQISTQNNLIENLKKEILEKNAFIKNLYEKIEEKEKEIFIFKQNDAKRNVSIPSNIKIFEGCIMNGKKTGICKETFWNDDYYKANYVNGIKEGLVEIKLNGVIITSIAKEDKICGKIEIYFIHSKNTIIGFCDDFSFKSDNIDISYLKTKNAIIKKISGFFDCDRFNGLGQILFNNGSFVKGFLKDNKLIRNKENFNTIIFLGPENQYFKIKKFGDDKIIETFENDTLYLDEEIGVLKKKNISIMEKNENLLSHIEEENYEFESNLTGNSFQNLPLKFENNSMYQSEVQDLNDSFVTSRTKKRKTDF